MENENDNLQIVKSDNQSDWIPLKFWFCRYPINYPSSNGINVYSFSVKPEKSPPSGSVNISRMITPLSSNSPSIRLSIMKLALSMFCQKKRPQIMTNPKKCEE